MECAKNENIDNPTMNPVNITVVITRCLCSNSGTSDSTTTYSFANNTSILTKFNQTQLLSHMHSIIATISEDKLGFYYNKIDTCSI